MNSRLKWDDCYNETLADINDESRTTKNLTAVHITLKNIISYNSEFSLLHNTIIASLFKWNRTVNLHAKHVTDYF